MSFFEQTKMLPLQAPVSSEWKQYEIFCIQQLLSLLSDYSPKSIGELNPRDFTFSNFFQAKYTGLYFPKSNPCSNLPFLWINTSGALPLENSQLDLFISCFILEQLRMDQVYMICSEARRVLKQNGIWALCTLHGGNSIPEKIIAKSMKHFFKKKPMELSHYVSPEDWIELQNKTITFRGIPLQIFIFQRTYNDSLHA